MGANGSKKPDDELTVQELTTYMGVQTTPYRLYQRIENEKGNGNTASSTCYADSTKSATTTSASAPTASSRPASTSTQPAVRSTTTASTANTASPKPAKTIANARHSTTSASHSTPSTSAVATAKWRPVARASEDDEEQEDEEDNIHNGPARKVLIARRTTKAQPLSTTEPNPFESGFSRMTYDDPYGYIAEAVRRTANEVNKSQEAAAHRPTPAPRTTTSTVPTASATAFRPVAPSLEIKDEQSNGNWWPSDIEDALSHLSVKEQQPAAAAVARTKPDAIANRKPKETPKDACSLYSDSDSDSEYVPAGFELHGPSRNKARSVRKSETLAPALDETRYSRKVQNPAPGENYTVYNLAERTRAYRARQVEAEEAEIDTAVKNDSPEYRVLLEAAKTLNLDYEIAKKQYPVLMAKAGLSKSAYEKLKKDRTAPGPMPYCDYKGDVDFGTDVEPWQRPFPLSSRPQVAPVPIKPAPPPSAFQPGRTLWEDDSDEGVQEDPAPRGGSMAAEAVRQATRSTTSAAPSAVPSSSTSTGYQWPADIDEALSRLSLADAKNGVTSQRKIAVPVRRAAAAAPVASSPAAEARPAAKARTTTTSSAQAASAATAAAAAARSAAAKDATTAAVAAAHPPYRFYDDEVPSTSRPNTTTAAPKPVAVVSASQAALQFAAAAAPAARAAQPFARAQLYSDDEDDVIALRTGKAARAAAIASTSRFMTASTASSTRPLYRTRSELSDEEGQCATAPPVRPLSSDSSASSEDDPISREQVLVNLASFGIRESTLMRKAELQQSFPHLLLADPEDEGTAVYTLSVGHKRVCLFEPAREKFIETRRELINITDIEEGQIYRSSFISKEGISDLSVPSDRSRMQLTHRASFVYDSPESYRKLIIPALLLGSRVRDFEQRCATVVQLGELVLNMPAQQNKRLKGRPLKLRTIGGQVFEVKVKFVTASDADKRWIVECETPEEPLPWKVKQGALLEIVGGYDAQPRVTGALMGFYAGKKFNFDQRAKPQQPSKPSEIGNWNLLNCIYGAPSKREFPDVTPVNPMIQLAKNAGAVQLNPEQADAVAIYNCDVCPAFVVESPPGSGKTMTAAAMAVSYKGDGVQLFLSTANVPVINMALALAKLDYGSLKAIHLISAEREDLMTEETRSPFSVLSLAKLNEDMNAQINLLETQLLWAPNEAEKDKIKAQIIKVCSPVFADTYDIYFATVDMILGRLFKNNQGGKHKVDAIKKQLVSSVRRIVVDEASQLTESALNALILCFPNAQIVLIGDCKQLPPFRYVPGDVVSELAARPALDVIKDKMNLPVITLSRVYRASPSMMAHYSDCFYEGGLESFKLESMKNYLSCFGSRSRGSKCLFWKVDKGIAKKQGTSKFNYGEIKSLKYIVNILKNSGYSEKEVMIISYYEAQRKKAEEDLKELGEYELLTVDSAQGREKKIVIVLTTRTSVPVDKGAFFSCALRCNVAVSRHQEALIVLGHPSIVYAPNWSRVLNQKYFRHVEDSKGWKGQARN